MDSVVRTLFSLTRLLSCFERWEAAFLKDVLLIQGFLFEYLQTRVPDDDLDICT